MLEAGAEILGDGAQIGMVGDHQRHRHRQFAGAGAPEQIQQHMLLAAHKDRHPRDLIGEVQLPLPPEAPGQGMGSGADRLPRQAETLQIPLQPAEEHSGASVGVVIGVADVAAVARHPAGDLAHQAGPVGADQLQDGAGRSHGEEAQPTGLTCRAQPTGLG